MQLLIHLIFRAQEVMCGSRTHQAALCIFKQGSALVAERCREDREVCISQLCEIGPAAALRHQWVTARGNTSVTSCSIHHSALIQNKQTGFLLIIQQHIWRVEVEVGSIVFNVSVHAGQLLIKKKGKIISTLYRPRLWRRTCVRKLHDLLDGNAFL